MFKIVSTSYRRITDKMYCSHYVLTTTKMLIVGIHDGNNMNQLNIDEAGGRLQGTYVCVCYI